MAGRANSADSQEGFDSPVQADLHWAVFGPPLLAFRTLTKLVGPSIDAASLTEDGPAPWPGAATGDGASNLPVFDTGLLGKRFESLIHCWLIYHPRLELLAHNLPIESDRTLTEFDFIVRDRSSGQCIHLETACKYYLAASNSTSHRQWIGTNPDDRLDKKIETTRRQFEYFQKAKLSILPECSSAAGSCLMLKGYFFVPFHLLGNHCLPEGAHPHCQTGWYVHLRELAAFESREIQWWIPARERWMSPVHYPVPAEEIIDGFEMKEKITGAMHKDGRARLIIQLMVSGPYFREISRGFVVPDNWLTP